MFDLSTFTTGGDGLVSRVGPGQVLTEQSATPQGFLMKSSAEFMKTFQVFLG